MIKGQAAFYTSAACGVILTVGIVLFAGTLPAGAEQSAREPPSAPSTYLETPRNVIATEVTSGVQPENSHIVVPESDAADFKVEVPDEAAERLRRAIAVPDTPDKAVQTEAAISGDDSDFDYDSEIQKAKDRGDTIVASYLETCRDTPAGGVLLTPASMEETILALCKVREFDVQASTNVWEPTIVITSSSPSGNPSKQANPAMAACRNETEKHVTKCVPQLGNCTMTGCEYNYVCDAGRLSSCKSTDSINYGSYYCDTRNRKHTAYSKEKVIAMACKGK